MSTQTNNNGMWVVVVLAIGAGLIVSALSGNNSGSSTVPSPSVDRSSFEHRYATERLKQEGYSGSEAQQAADAIIKFHNAQKARQR